MGLFINCVWRCRILCNPNFSNRVSYVLSAPDAETHVNTRKSCQEGKVRCLPILTIFLTVLQNTFEHARRQLAHQVTCNILSSLPSISTARVLRLPLTHVRSSGSGGPGSDRFDVHLPTRQAAGSVAISILHGSACRVSRVCRALLSLVVATPTGNCWYTVKSSIVL